MSQPDSVNKASTDSESGRALHPIPVSRVVSAEDSIMESLQSIADECFPNGAPDIQQELSRPWARIWVARHASLQCASGLLLAWHAADEIQLLNLATAPPVRRSGVARALLGALLRYAAHTRSRIIVLDVRRSNRPAVSLYRRFGFTVGRVRRAYYGDDDEDALEMTLGIDPETGQPQLGHDEIQVDARCPSG